MTILAIDLGKFKSVACIFNATTPGSDKARFRTLPTTPAAVHDLMVSSSPGRVVIEVCTSAGWVADLAEALGIDVQVANPNTEGWRWNHVKRKTDRDDALKLAKLSAAAQLPTVHLPGAGVRRWRSLIVYRHKLVARRTAIYNRIRALLDSVGRSHPAGGRGWSREALETLRGLAAPLRDCEMEELWRGEMHVELQLLDALQEQIAQVESKLDAIGEADARVRRVRSIPGVGPRLGELVVAMLDDPHRFRSARQVGAYAGLVPRRYQSGTYDYQGRVSKQGCALLRKLLVEVAWAMRRHNPEARVFFDRVCGGEKTRRKKAAVGLGRKVLIWCWALLRDERDWSPPPPEGRPREEVGSPPEVRAASAAA
jgi:transposase